MATPGILDLFIGTDRKMRPMVGALLYSALAFWRLSSEGLLGPVIQRVAKELHVGAVLIAAAGGPSGVP